MARPAHNGGPVKKTTTSKLSLKKEHLRVLSDKALERANGGVYTSTIDVCSTESNTKCFNKYANNNCYARK